MDQPADGRRPRLEIAYVAHRRREDIFLCGRSDVVSFLFFFRRSILKHSVTTAPAAQGHAEGAQAAVLPAVVVFLLLVDDYCGSLWRWPRDVVCRLLRWVVGSALLRRRVVTGRWRLEPRLGRVVGVRLLLPVAHREVGPDLLALDQTSEISVSGTNQSVSKRRAVVVGVAKL